MLPPQSADLLRRVVSRNARRIRDVSIRLPDFAASRQDREACRALIATLSSLRGPDRTRFHLAPQTRAWLSAAEEAMALARPLEEEMELFERVAQGAHLAVLLPAGRLDAGFRRRTMVLGAKLLEEAFRRLPPVLAFLTPTQSRFGPFAVELSADGEAARRQGEVHLWFPAPGTLRLRPGARLELADGGIRILQPVGRSAEWEARQTIPGTDIVLGCQVVSTRKGLRTASGKDGLRELLAEAMELIRRSWKAGHREVLTHTLEVIPLSEKGTVSYSLPTRPGTSYINVDGKRAVDLADDLLHETAHHRLHSFEQLGPLHRANDEAVYYSPWRRSMRPLQGILHAAYTFTWRAELFQRMLELRGRLPKAWMRRETRREIDMLRRSVVDLEDARERKLLTAAGGELVGAIARHVARFSRNAA